MRESGVPMESPSGEVAAAPEATRLKLIRVKRKRGAEAPEGLVVEALEAPSKRANTSLSGALAGLGLRQGSGSDDDQQAPAGEAGGAAPACRRQQRFRKLSTLSAAQLHSMDQAKLQTLLAAGQLQRERAAAARAPRAGVKGGSGPAPVADRAAQQLQAGATARYEHIRRLRGMSAFTITEQLADPLQQLAAVYDVVRHEPQQGAEGEQPPPAAPPPSQQQPQQRRPSRAQRAAQQYDEGTLVCNYLPMIRQYLRSQGRDMPDEAAAVAAGAASGDAAEGMDEEGGSDGEYVYDLYAALEEEGEEEGGEGAQEAGWWDAHASGHAPVVQILDDDTWVVLERSDADDSDADTEDSNAEGYYAHDYPEEASGLDSSDDDGYDPEGGTFGGVRQQGAWGLESGSSDDD